MQKFALGCAVAVVLVVALSSSAVPRSLRETDDLRDLCDVVMAAVAGGDIISGYRALAPFWTLTPDAFAKRLTTVRRERAELLTTLGFELGNEFVRKDTHGDRLVRLVYLERFEKGGLVWHFVFFKPAQIWQLVEVTISSDLEILFDR